MKTHWKYRIGDLLAGAVLGASVVFACHILVPANLGLVGSLALGMVVGMAAQMVICLFFGAFLGSMEMMVPGMFVGMLGMLLPIFPFHELWVEIVLGATLGLVVFLGFAIWDEQLRGKLLSVQTPKQLAKVAATVKQSAALSSGWWSFSWLYDALEGAGSTRRAPPQKELFRAMEGKVLFAAAGTGLNFTNFPPGKEIMAIDLSPQMLDTARARADRYEGHLSLQEANVQQLPFPDECFDTAATASTFCSITDPVKGLQELYRVLRPGGRLLMFEHVRSQNPVLGAELDLLNIALRRLGPEMNRDTVGNAQRAGFVVDQVRCVYLDIFLSIEAHKPAHTDEGSARCLN